MAGVPDLGQFSPISLFIIFIWSLLWKGLALWRAATLNQRIWFIVMLIFNTVGILELVYLFGFAKKRFKISELKFWK
ncbi:MAG: hypothetical protein A2W22_00360 [Candidatus Levybacteria bacterium RBG_16_35_11]|nr:MAG: hypothetical protein A2W22_00360 [Candidatus Levybacteria bacterium RBG_16_35_11]